MAHNQESALPRSFHPLIQSWFAETFGQATAVQAEAWPLIEKGEHVLAISPTGSGKTLTAFLSALSRFCPDSVNTLPQYPADKLTVLYVSPLKALNEDIKRNLLEPLAAIRSRFEAAGLPFPPVRVETRSGDTPQAERRRFLIHPPSILASTPESLAILLLNPKGRAALATVKYLILDEIHAVLGNKRGAFLSCQIDRLSLTAGEFQRVSLSATVRNPEIAAEFTGGSGRTVRIVSPPAEKQIDFRIEYPDDVDGVERIDKYGKRYTGLINYILNRISSGSTLLVFTDSRRRAERLCFFLNQEGAVFQKTVAFQKAAALNARNGGGFSGQAAFTHHGSLSKELRRNVEQRLAEGSLPCVVATASLELGIDIGSVDEVILAGSPSGVSQSLQRIGRSGHGAGRTSRGVLFPFHGMDLLLAGALQGAVEDRDIEEQRPIENPLDILAQLILALCVEKNRNIEELYTLLRGFYIFKSLNKDAYTRTVRMLAGLGEKGRLRELKPRIWLDKSTGEIGALEGTLLLLYSSGGVIANRGLYSLRTAEGVKIGELDEEFVWERRLGDCFDFGGQGWRITAIGAESVDVLPLDAPADFIPFWKADSFFRSPNLTNRVLAVLDCYNANGTPDNRAASQPDTARAALKSFLDSQRNAQGGLPLPDSGNITVEIIDSPETRGDFYSAVIHSFRGGAVHYPLSLALAQELEETLEIRAESFSSDDGILFLIPRLGATENCIFAVETLFRRAFSSLESDGGRGLSRGERLFRNRLESSGVFGAAFREAAERSLLLPKTGFGKRTPLWIMRQRSKRLFDAVVREDGFPVTAEAWRACLADTFDMEGFRELLAAVNNGTVTLSFFRSGVPSPFSANMVRQETNALMYEYDERKDMRSISDMPGVSSGGYTRGGYSRQASLSDRAIEDALGNAALRPRLKRDLVLSFVSRLRRELPGWAPEDELSLCEWVKERIAIPLDEWENLRAALPEALRGSASLEALLSGSAMEGYIKIVKRKNAAVPSAVHREWAETWENEALTLLGPWLRYEGPVSLLRITEVFGADAAGAEDAVNALAEVDEIARDVSFDSETADNADNDNAETAEGSLACDRENFEMLLRLSRKKARPIIKERPAALLVPFLALRQGIRAAGDVSQNREHSGFPSVHFLNILAAYPAPARVWETEFFPARQDGYEPEIIDREIREGRLIWYGAGKEKIGFCQPEDLELIQKIPRTDKTGGLALLLQSGFFDRPRDFWEIKEAYAKEKADLSSRDCAEALWREAWQGRLSSDSFEPVRRGLGAGFIPKETEGPRFSDTPYIPGRHPRLPRALRDRWREGTPVPGRWFSLSIDEEGGDSLDEENLNRDRVRLLLKRWGLICRPLLEHEEPPFSWSGLLPAIRRMELAGELIAGRFFAGIDSLQFASPAIMRELEQAEAFTGIYWMNAADPASPAGLALGGPSPCARLPGSRLYFRGKELIAVSNRNARDITLLAGPDDQHIALLIGLFTLPRTRKALPESKIPVEKINGKNAAQSEYAALFEAAGFVKDRGKLCRW